jgi:hypothetical protein
MDRVRRSVVGMDNADRRHPMNVTYYVVVPFDRNEEGDLVTGDAKEATRALSAERGARAAGARTCWRCRLLAHRRSLDG